MKKPYANTCAHVPTPFASVHQRIRMILSSARSWAARSVNTAQVTANWRIGREIVQDEQRGRRKSGYGQRLIASLSVRLQREYGVGYSATNLKLFRQFYLTYPILVSRPIGHTACDQSWKPGLLHPNLSWSMYRNLIGIESAAARAFYEIEASRNNWSARELERQIASLLYERLALSRDRDGLARLSRRGHEPRTAADVFKDPVVMEFLGLPEAACMTETNVEEALITHLQGFLMELGKGFAFVSRQERISLEGDHFYIDLVFYHTILKCYVLIDLKAGKLTHQDVGQLQLYVNYFDQKRRTRGDHPTLGLILCTDKNDAVVRYTLGPDQRKTIFASRYRLHLPSTTELRRELRDAHPATLRLPAARHEGTLSRSMKPKG